MSNKGGYFKEESDTLRLAQRIRQSERSSSISTTDLEGNYVDALDPEKLIQCPYDTHHQIRACRFPYHLIKCRKNHPEIAKQLVTCPFNARHQVPRAEISHHISSCDDKSCIEQDIVSQLNDCHREKMNTVSMWQPPPCDEDWDKDLQEQSSSTFIWGTFNSGVNNSPGSSIVMEQKNNLIPGMRAPKSLPHSLSWKSRTSMTFSPQKEQKETPRSWQYPPCQEDWEADADEPAATSPFVLGFKANRTLSASQSVGETGRDGNRQMQAMSTAAAWDSEGSLLEKWLCEALAKGRSSLEKS